jgi:hypothetical protein
MFRFKKYGEPNLNDQTTWSIHDCMSENDQIPLVEYPQSIKEIQKLINSKLDQIDRYLSGKNESDKASLTSEMRGSRSRGWPAENGFAESQDGLPW